MKNINQILKRPEFSGCSSYGAQMGRRNTIGENGKLHLQHLRSVDGDYDVGGAYWGGAYDLYCAFAPDLVENKKATCIFVRADDHEEAKEKVIEVIEQHTGEFSGWSFVK